MSSRLLQPASEISTHFRCDNCGVSVDKGSWMQCKICKAFDLCDRCATIEYDKLRHETLDNHRKLHPDISLTKDCMKLVLVEEAETDGRQARLQRREEEYERITHEKKILNDYDMSVVMDRLAHESSSNDNPLTSLIVGYYSKANQRNIHVLCLDGGGKNQ